MKLSAPSCVIVLLGSFVPISAVFGESAWNPEVSLVAPPSFRVVQGSAPGGLDFTVTNLNTTASTTFDLGLAAGDGGFNRLTQPNATPPGGMLVSNAPAGPWNGAVLLKNNTGIITATPNISGVVAGQTVGFGIQASNANWNAPVTAITSINVVANRLLTGSVTIDAGRHMAGLRSIGSVTLSGGASADSEATRISVNGGGYAQLSNGLRLTSSSDFTFNGANQTHDLQIAYYGKTGKYTIAGAALPGAGQNGYTDADGAKHQEFGGSWTSSAEYGNAFGEKKVFSEVDRSTWGSSNIAWQRPDRPNSYQSDSFIYKQELAETPQPGFAETRSDSNATGVSINWELARGEGALLSERVNPLISGEAVQGSRLDLSGVVLNVTGTAVADRTISGGMIYLGRQMVGSANSSIVRNDTVLLTTSGDDDHQTRLNLASFASSNGTGVSVSHTGNSTFKDSAHTASVNVVGNFIQDSSVPGRRTQMVDVGSSITGEGLAGETVQNQLEVGYTWNNVQDNSLGAVDLLVLDSDDHNGTRSYSTAVYRLYSTETHTNIGVSGNQVMLNGKYSAGLYDLGNTTVRAIAEGLAGENATATATFNTKYASIADASVSVSAAGSTLTDGSNITIRDTGSGIFQNTVAISDVSLTGGESLDYQLVYSGGSSLLAHNESRTLTIDYIGNSAIPSAGELGRISKADLSIRLMGVVNYGAIQAAAGGSRVLADNTGYDDKGAYHYAIETRFDAPAATAASSAVSAGTDFSVNGLTLGNTTDNTSSRFGGSMNIELVDSNTLSFGTTVHVEFVALDNADPAVIDALENDSTNAASLAGIYGGAGVFASDLVELTGLDGVTQVIQISYDDTVAEVEAGAQMLWRYSYSDDTGAQIAWINAVLGNSNISDLDLAGGTLVVGGAGHTIQDYLSGTRYNGSYADYLAANSLTSPELGAWGLDMETNKVWSVIDHNSTFAVSVPEPGIAILLVIGSGFGVAKRRRR